MLAVLHTWTQRLAQLGVLSRRFQTRNLSGFETAWNHGDFGRLDGPPRRGRGNDLARCRAVLGAPAPDLDIQAAIPPTAP